MKQKIIQAMLALALSSALGMATTGCKERKQAAQVQRLAEIRQFVQLRASYQQTPDYYSEGGSTPALNEVAAKSGLSFSGYETTPAWTNLDMYGEEIVIREAALKDGVRAVGRANGTVELVRE